MVVGLFKSLERRFLRELPFTAQARYEVVGIPHGQRGPKIEADALVIARRAGNLPQSKRHIGLGLQVKVHVGMDWKRVETFLADTPPLAVGSHKPFVKAEAGLFADGTLDCAKAPFHFLLREGDHQDSSDIRYSDAV